MPSPHRTLVAVVTVAALAVAAVTTAPVAGDHRADAVAPGQVVLSAGHVDALDVHYDGGELVLKVKDDTGEPPPVIRDPADVTLQALPESAIEVPDDPAYAFLGEPGSTVWILPQTQEPSLLWPGWNTQTLNTGVFNGDAVDLRLIDIAGPGQVSVFTIDEFGVPTIVWSGVDGLPDTIDVPVRTHAHANWAFGALGSYVLTFAANATLIDGTPLTTGPVPFRFVVGELPPDPEVTLTITGLQPSYRPGNTVTLTAVAVPPSTLDIYSWLRRCPGATEFTVVPGEAGAAYDFTATEMLNGCHYKARLLDGETVTAESPAVTLTVIADPVDLSETITATIDESLGALVVSVDPNDRTVVLPVAQLAPGGDRWQAAAELRPVTVTDTRSGKPGWNVSGQVSDFTGAGGIGFDGKYLGWTPRVLSQAPGQGVVAGPPVPTGFVGGGGLKLGGVLGTAPADTGRGTARLGATLLLELPTDVVFGQYTATLTLTAI